MPQDNAFDAAMSLIADTGESPFSPDLKETPTRFANAWHEWMRGYRAPPLESVLTTFPANGMNEMVVQCGVPFFSHCAHHLAPFFGYAHIGYIPNGKIVGLSKLSRALEIFSRRLQVQERITSDLADGLFAVLQPLGVGVILHGRHLCMESRGIQRMGTVTATQALRGVIYTERDARTEFLQAVASQVGNYRP